MKLKILVLSIIFKARHQFEVKEKRNETKPLTYLHKRIGTLEVLEKSIALLINTALFTPTFKHFISGWQTNILEYNSHYKSICSLNKFLP